MMNTPIPSKYFPIFASLLFAFPTPPLILADTTDQPPVQMTLTQFKGKAFTKTADQDQWVPARKGILLHEGDSVKTAKRGWAEITSQDGDLIEVDELSQFTIEHSRPLKSSVRLFVGRFLFNVFKRPKRHYHVRTPVATVAIRGTEFSLYQIDDDTWEGGLLTGHALVQSTADFEKPEEGELMIDQGDGFRIVRGQKPVRLVGLPPRVKLLRPRFNRMRKRLLDLKRQQKRDILKKRRELRKELQRK